ncbi:9568_t:CDS:2, partial [Dentiscutata erythropus]
KSFGYFEMEEELIKLVRESQAQFQDLKPSFNNVSCQSKNLKRQTGTYLCISFRLQDLKLDSKISSPVPMHLPGKAKKRKTLKKTYLFPVLEFQDRFQDLKPGFKIF